EGGEMTFSDKDAIADYAVADIAAMVRAGIVAGYTDGTIQPLGNTTRAEAAVIMDRIVTWNTNP
ncbi:MAG: S-layer homology domain-containing protein, partial [Clostridia bacterium]|nr:S-layer homology domain-containing protein [Clostridia bacterium]